MSESKPMPVERRTTQRRSAAAQEQIDAAAFEKAVQAERDLIGHERLCSERFKNLDAKIDSVNQGIQQLSDDAKKSIETVRITQEDYHKSNSAVLDELKIAVSALDQKVAIDQSQRSGAAKLFAFVKDCLLILLPLASVLYVMFGKHP